MELIFTASGRLARIHHFENSAQVAMLRRFLHGDAKFGGADLTAALSFRTRFPHADPESEANQK